MRFRKRNLTLLSVLGLLLADPVSPANARASRNKRESRSSGVLLTPVGAKPTTESNSAALFFIGISSRATPQSAPLREILRHTWLDWASSDERIIHRFFVNVEGRTSASNVASEQDVIVVPESKISHCPRGNERPAHNCRSGATVRYLLLWGLRRTSASFIVATEHDGFVCLPQLLLESQSWSLSSHVAHYAGDCTTKKENIFNPEQTFNVFGRNALTRIFQLISDKDSASFYIPSITFAQNIQPILRFLNERREIEILPDLDRIIVGINVKKNRPTPLTSLCTAGHLYFHFREAMNRMAPWATEMKNTFDKHGNKSVASLTTIAKTTDAARNDRLSCTKKSCPLPPESQAWWCCPFYGKQLIAEAGRANKGANAASILSRQRESCRGIIGS